MEDFLYKHTVCNDIVLDQICGTLSATFDRHSNCSIIGPNCFDYDLQEFHIEILRIRDGGEVSIGVCQADYQANSQIGWREKSIGYHSDNGGIYMEDGCDAKVMLPTYGAGDTVGCCFDVQNKRLKFTKNHEVVYETVISFDFDRLYPAIAIGSQGTCINLLEKRVWSTCYRNHSYQCKICDEGKDTVGRCIECDESYCNNCLDRHKQGRKSRFHTILKTDEFDREQEVLNQIYCLRHEFEEWSRYCSTCSKLICAECLQDGHKDHEMARIEDLVQIKREKIEEVTKTAKEKSRPVRRVVDAMSTLIKRRAQFLREMVIEAEHELLHLNAAVVGDMDKAIEEGESIFESHNNKRIVARDAHMTSLIEEIEKTPVPLKLSQNEIDEKLLTKTSDMSEPNPNEAN